MLYNDVQHYDVLENKMDVSGKVAKPIKCIEVKMKERAVLYLADNPHASSRL